MRWRTREISRNNSLAAYKLMSRIVENTPFEVGVQINFTSGKVEKLTFRISLMLTKSKRECS